MFLGCLIHLDNGGPMFLFYCYGDVWKENNEKSIDTNSMCKISLAQ